MDIIFLTILSPFPIEKLNVPSKSLFSSNSVSLARVTLEKKKKKNHLKQNVLRVFLPYYV